MKKKLESEYILVDVRLDSAQFEKAMEVMRNWKPLHLIQFLHNYPHRSNLLKFYVFDDFWAERRSALYPAVQFEKQNSISDYEQVVGYTFYCLALKHKSTFMDEQFLTYLKGALEYNSIHAAQSYIHYIVHEHCNPVKKLERLRTTLIELKPLAVKQGTPGFLLLAQGYLHLIHISRKNDEEPVDTDSFEVWKNLILAELLLPQSQASINNAYFGQGLALSTPQKISNPKKSSTIEGFKNDVKKFIDNSTLIEAAEEKATQIFRDFQSQAQLSWIKTRGQTSSTKPSSNSIKRNDLTPKLF